MQLLKNYIVKNITHIINIIFILVPVFFILFYPYEDDKIQEIKEIKKDKFIEVKCYVGNKIVYSNICKDKFNFIQMGFYNMYEFVEKDSNKTVRVYADCIRKEWKNVDGKDKGIEKIQNY